MVNFDLSTRKLKSEFSDKGHRRAYALIKRFFINNNFEHHQYSGYLSKSAISYGDVYFLILDSMVAELPWLAECVEKFDATNVTSQSNMLSALKNRLPQRSVEIPSLLEGDAEVVL